VQDVMDNALEGRGTSNYELEFRTKSNEIRHLLVNATTRRDAENNVVGVVGVAQDVTEAVQRDRAVAGMALELRQLIDTANAPIFGIDIDGNVNEWNRRTSEITGYSKEEAFDEPLVETFIAPSMQEKVQEILDSALEGNETSNYELEFVARCGEPRFLLVNATTRRDPENIVVGGKIRNCLSGCMFSLDCLLINNYFSSTVVGVAQDVTEDRKHAQALREMQYLRASQEAKVETERNMTAYFAHELRNPLGAIDSALNAMPDDLPETAKSLVSGMQLCTGFMSSIMNNLLDVRKMEEGKMKLMKSPISLKKLLNGVHKMLLPSLRPGVDFLKVCKTKGIYDWILGDAHRIQQVMTNVVTNAIKYTVTGSVTLTIDWKDGVVIFQCEDTGPGIPKNEQEKLFQRFVQRGGAPGTGLGLAIAKHLVDLTGGSIRFDSDPTVKAGTTCVVLMPLSLCDAPETVVEESTALIEEPITFLIIDDIKMNRMMLKRRVMKSIAPHSKITEAATGEQALEICGKEKFDVIVVDQYMEEAGGVMVGTDVVFAMRRMRIDSVIIGCSGNDMGTQFFEAGADWVWQKPMPSNVKIIQDLRASLNKRHLERQQVKA
jgi:PAS domain S-box-containing protein